MVLHLEPLAANQWVDALLSGERGHVIDIGQLQVPDIMALNAAVKHGLLTKSREPWTIMGGLGIGPLKTVWRSATKREEIAAD